MGPTSSSTARDEKHSHEVDSPTKSVVFRVNGLPAGPTEDDTVALLRRVIDDNLSEDERQSSNSIVRVVPSCYEDGRTWVALVEFKSGIPNFLSDLIANPLGGWEAEIEDIDIAFDQHFHGFTQLYATRPGHAVTADVIAITGLDGHAYGSWRGKGNLGRMWLRDFLSKDLPDCRVMTFGGIILAHCLIKAVQTNEQDHPAIATLYKATYGMLLFGIPHKGMIVDDIEKMLAGADDHPRRALLEQIDSKSEFLMEQLVDFKNMIRDRKVVSFYETLQTRGLVFNEETQRWERTGACLTAVETDSAMLHLPDHIEEKIPLHVDHSQLVKFDSRDAPGYRSARDKLIQFKRDAPTVITSRFHEHASSLEPLFTTPSDWPSPSRVDQCDADGRTPLHRAIIMGDHNAVQYLVEKGARVDIRDCCGNTALDVAAEKGWPKIIRMTTQAGLKSNGIERSTGLHRAAFFGDRDTVRSLLSASADPNARDIYDASPLHYAMFSGDSEIVRLLIKEGADVNLESKHWGTALHKAAYNGFDEITKMLLDAGGDVRAVKAIGSWTVLRLALFNHKFTTAEIISQHLAHSGRIGTAAANPTVND